VQREVAGDLEDEVGDEEDARAEAVDRAGEAEVASSLSWANVTFTRSR
jgi:hypothetical protein